MPAFSAVLADMAASRGLIDVKRTALLFDNVIVLKTKEGEHDNDIRKSSPLFGVDPSEVDWLVENGVVSFVKDYSEDLYDSNDPKLKKYRNYRAGCQGQVFLLPETGPEYEAFVRATATFVARYSATRIQEVDEDKRAVPLLYEPKYELGRLGARFEFPYSEEPKGSYALTTAAVLTAFPVPDELTPWEDILEFRQQNQNRLAFFALREWIKQAARTDSSVADLKETIEYGVAKTERDLEAIKIKHRWEKIETLVTAGSDVLEGALEAKLKLSPLLKAPFSIFKSHLETLEDEAKIAENGFYYIVKAKERFSRRKSRKAAGVEKRRE